MLTAFKNIRYKFGFFATAFILFLAAAVYTGYFFLAAIPFAALFFYTSWQHLHWVFFVLIFVLPFSTELQISATLGTDFPDEPLMLLVSVLFFCYWIFTPGSVSKKIWNHPLTWILLISVGWAVISSMFSTKPLLSLKFLLAKSWYIGAFVLAALIVCKEKAGIRTMAFVFTAAMLTVAFITLCKHSLYGFSFADINRALKPFFRNHVNYSAMLVCSIPIVFVYWQKVNNKRYKTLAAILLLLSLAALLLSYARGAWLALLVGILTALLIKKKRLVYAYIAGICITAAALYWIKTDDRYLKYAHDYRTTIFHEDFRDHLVATYEFKDVSTAERFYRWIAGVRMIKDNWLTGFGPNSFYANYQPYTIPAFKTWVSDNPEHSTVHNYFLLIAIEQGIPGLIIFLLLCGAMLLYAQRLYHRCKDPFYKNVSLIAGIILAMIMTVNFLSDLIETDKIGSLFFLCIALLISADVNDKKASELSPHI